MERPVVQRVRRKNEVRSILAGYRFGAGRFSGSATTPAQREPKEVRFRRAFEELGGIYAAFGAFLAGRADLLPSPFLRELEKIKLPLLINESVDPGSMLPQVSEVRPVGHSLYCRFYEGVVEGGPVVLEVFGAKEEQLREKEWGHFRKGMSFLREDPLTAKVAQDQILDEFKNWVELEGDLDRKRRLLGNLQELPASCITRFPKLVSSLQTDRILGYEKPVGIPLTLDESAGSESEKRLQLLMEAFLEQSLLLSAIPSMASFNRLLLLDGGQIGFEVCPALDSVPAECNYQLLQYLTSAVAGDRSRAIQMLSSLVDEMGRSGSEPKLWQELSAQAGDLDARSPFPESVNALNSYARALTDAGLKKPRFLELFNRNLVLLGQRNAQTCPGSDLLSESIWPVLGRLMKYQLSQGLSAQRMKEWVMGSGLAIMGASRQMSIILEQLRLNDLSLMIAAQPAGGTERDSGQSSWMIAVLTLVLFFISLQLAFATAHSSLGLVAGILAIITALGLFIHLMRLN